MSLRRRRLLGLLSAGTVAPTGCVDLPGQASEESGTPTPEPGPAAGCPPYDRWEVERVVCSADPPDDALVFRPDPERAALPRAEIACRFENDRSEDFSSNFYSWSLHVHDDDAWRWLGPYGSPDPLHSLPPGSTHVRRLLVDNTELERIRPPTPETDADEYGSGRHGLGPGTYAVAITSSSEGPSTAYAAAFTLEGDPIDLVAPEHVQAVDRDGTTVEVAVESTSSEYDLDRYDLTVGREPYPRRDPHPFVDEQLYDRQHAGLRAALVHVDPDVQGIVVRGDDSQVTRGLASGRGPDYIAYDGDTFVLQVDPHDG